MKKIIFCALLFLVFFVTANTLFAEVERGVKPPAEVAKEYVAEKYNYNVDDLTIGDVMIGRGGAHIDVNYGYDTEKVVLKRKDFESDWEIENSEPAHQY